MFPQHCYNAQSSLWVTPRSVTTKGVTLLSVPGKVLARILLDRVRQRLLTHQRHEQSSFTPKKSTVDRILALRVLTERLRDFRIGLLAAYVDLSKAFEPRCTLENPGPPRNTAAARQPDIRPVFWDRKCCKL